MLPWWPLVSKKLDLEWVPNAPFWAAPVIRLGATWFYRLTPGVLAWLEAAGQVLEHQVVAGRVGRDQLDVYLAVMTEVWRFAEAALDPEAVRAARAAPPTLPEVPYVPAADTSSATLRPGHLVPMVSLRGIGDDDG